MTAGATAATAAPDPALTALVSQGQALNPDDQTTYEERVAAAQTVLRWAAGVFGESLTVASSMGDEALVHLVGTTIPHTEVFFLDTGYHFAETIGTRDAYAALLPIRLRTVLPQRTVAEQDAELGPRLYERDPDACCALRKVEPLERALADRRAWVTGMRRVDASTRGEINLVELDGRRQMVKLNPLALWTDDDLDRFIADNGVFLNPLRMSGFTSIGCAPCTRPVAAGEDPRAGRWAGRTKTECGLHT